MRGLRITGVLCGAFVAVSAAFVALAPHYSTELWWEIRRSLYVVVPSLMLALGVLICVAWHGLDRRRHATGSRRIWVLAPRVVLTASVGAGFVLLCWWVTSLHPYAVARAYYAATVVSGSPAPEFAQRAPYQVAQAQARPNLGDVSGDIVDTTYLPQRDVYATLVSRRGPLAGYQTVLEEHPTFTTPATARTCAFDVHRATARDGGLLNHNLARMIHEQQRWVEYNSDDLYSYCDGSVPMVVAPLKRQVGWFVVTERPAGIALYNGKTGQLTFRTDSARIPGPAYPRSLAEQQRAAVSAPGSYWDYRAQRTGFEPDTDEVNADNNTELTLPGGPTRTPAYVTPLTGRGSASAIAALAEITATARSGSLAPLRVHLLAPSWKSTTAIAARIKNDYQDVPNWQNLKVFEVAPMNSSQWVATIGVANGQDVTYRVQGTGTLTGQHPTCLLRVDGSTLRCGSLTEIAGSTAPPSAGPGGSPAGAPIPGDLRGLSNQQLADLAQRVDGELARRLGR